MSDKTAPSPPRLEEVLRAAKGLPKTLTQQMYEQFEARLVANGGKLVPLTAEEIAQGAPPPPDLAEALRTAAKERNSR